jgi:uncharacterized membrane protein
MVKGAETVQKSSVRKLTLTALLLGMNVIMSSSVLSIPVPGGHMYLNDVIIVMAALILDPLYAAAVGGLGAFLGDMLFYPAPMFVSLVTHGLQAALVSWLVRKLPGGKTVGKAAVAAFLGLVVTVAGYTFGRAYIYGTPEYAVLKFPFQVLQTAVGSAIALALYFATPIRAAAKKELDSAV